MGTTVYVLVFTATGATAALKGRWLLFAAGLLLGPAIWAISFLLPAKPRSWWFERLYDDRRRLSATKRVESGSFPRR